MTTSKPVRRFATAFLIAVAIAFQCVGRQGIAIGGSWRMDWAQEYGWPWVSLSMLFTSQGSMLGGRFTTAYELPDTVHWWWTSASGIFVLPLLGNIAWWAALILLVHRALTPSPDSGS